MKRTWQSSLKEEKIINDIRGLIILDKPKGISSNFCLTILKKCLHPRKIGHIGTLDENATGVLVCLLGDATKCQEYLMKTYEKVYEAELILGIGTDTEDITGKVISDDKEIAKSFDIRKIKDTIKSFVGTYEQVPPMYSAKKIAGKKLLDMARKGISVERKACKVSINSIDIIESDNYDYEFNNHKYKKIDIRVSCSKGTYIRTLCKDIGEKIGIPSCMGNLRRLAVGDFKTTDSVTLDVIKEKALKGDLSFIKPCYYMKNNSVLTFGKFEMLHLGHQKIINQVISDAKESSLESTVVLVGNVKDTAILSKDQRISKLKYLGVDNICNFPLNEYTMNMGAEDFAEEVLIRQLKAKEIVVGSDCRFGYKGLGDKKILEDICRKHSVVLKIIDKIKVPGTDIFISSTLIKEEYEKGNFELVDSLLGKKV